MKASKLFKAVRHPSLAVRYLMERGYFRWMSDEAYLKLMFRCAMGRELRLEAPRTFNEKLQWLKLYDRNPRYTQMVDKYAVRGHIAESIGEEYLIPLLGVYGCFDEIDFDVLPDQFVLKCTHDSGSAVLCRDKAKFDRKAAKEKLDGCLRRNYYDLQREWPYKDVKPRIVCEKLITDGSGSDLMDYKFMCFNGKVRCSFVCLNRNTGLNVDFYDPDWHRMPFERHYPRGDVVVQKPRNYDLMVRLSEQLAEEIPFVRVDFYEVGESVYFGEMTFFPGSGFEEFSPERYDELLGSWLTLPERNDCG